MPLHRALDTRDVDEARERIARSYCPHRLEPRAGAAGFRARHAVAGGPELGVFVLDYGAGPSTWPRCPSAISSSSRGPSRGC